MSVLFAIRHTKKPIKGVGNTRVAGGPLRGLNKIKFIAEKAAKREKLVQALANKEDQELTNLSADEIRSSLAELD